MSTPKHRRQAPVARSGARDDDPKPAAGAAKVLPRDPDPAPAATKSADAAARSAKRSERT